jgi:rhamnogalacturonyl hydrolase YesR
MKMSEITNKNITYNRTTMKKTVRIILLLAMIPVITLCITRSAEESKEEIILQAMNEAADYLSTTIIDENGISRCDYNLTEGKWYPYEPPWHTGQAIYALTDAYRLTGKSSYLETAKKSGDWWVSLEIKNHPKLNGMLNAIHGDHAGQVIVFATVSDGTAGLFKLHEATGEAKYAEVPTRAGDWMLENMCLLDEGVCYDNVDPETGEVLKENSPFWPDKEDQGLWDVARPNNEGSLFLDMYQFTGKEEYKEAFLVLCESLVETQLEGLWMDFMPNHKPDGSVHPRFNLWYAESLLEGYELTGDRRYLEAARKTAATFARFQKANGTIYYQNFLSGEVNKNSVCGSAVAFAGILWLRLESYGIEEFSENIDLSLDWILKNRFSTDHPDPNLAGAVINTRLRNRHGKLWFVNRDIGTSFGIRFLAAYCDHRLVK